MTLGMKKLEIWVCPVMRVINFLDEKSNIMDQQAVIFLYYGLSLEQQQTTIAGHSSVMLVSTIVWP